MKTNFKKTSKPVEENQNETMTKEEFEEFIVKTGAKGSFMVYRTDKKDQELGIDEL